MLVITERALGDCSEGQMLATEVPGTAPSKFDNLFVTLVLEEKGRAFQEEIGNGIYSYCLSSAFD